MSGKKSCDKPLGPCPRGRDCDPAFSDGEVHEAERIGSWVPPGGRNDVEAMRLLAKIGRQGRGVMRELLSMLC